MGAGAFVPFRKTIALGALACAVACAPARAPVPGRTAVPSCPRGSFASELERLLPPLEPVHPITLVPAEKLAKRIEPGCVVPFRSEPDERLLDVGRVVAKTMRRSDPNAKPTRIGRGRLRVGRRALQLELHDDGGDEVLALVVEGARVSLRERGAPSFERDVRLDEDDPLPLPLDALVAALDVCDGDLRLGRTPDGNVVEARRGPLSLWRSRWVDAHASAIVDTSVACGADDARLLWRTAVGDLLPMIAVASARSDRVLVIVRQGPTALDDDVGFGAMP